MSGWRIHYMNANGQLDGLIEPIGESIERARLTAETVTPEIVIDVVVQVWPGRVIKEMGFSGYAPTGTMMQLTFDPENPALESKLGEPVERMVAHESHHVLRWRDPGYGTTLREALVTEGLAGRFCEQLYESEPEPWEGALSGGELVACAKKAAEAWNESSYSHDRWFFGTGDLPHWAGYSLGYALVGQYLDLHPESTPASLVCNAADDFRDALSQVAA